MRRIVDPIVRTLDLRIDVEGPPSRLIEPRAAAEFRVNPQGEWDTPLVTRLQRDDWRTCFINGLEMPRPRLGGFEREFFRRLLTNIPVGRQIVLLLPQAAMVTETHQEIRETLGSRFRIDWLVWFRANAVIPDVNHSFELVLVFATAAGGRSAPLRLVDLRNEHADIWTWIVNVAADREIGEVPPTNIVRDVALGGGVWTYEQHTERHRAREGDLLLLGGRGLLAQWIEFVRCGISRLRNGGEIQRRTRATSRRSVPLFSGRDIDRDGLLAPASQVLMQPTADLIEQHGLHDGDVLLRRITGPIGENCPLIAAVVCDTDGPALANDSVLVLRWRSSVSAETRRFLFEYLRSPTAAALLGAVGAFGNLTPDQLGALPTPLPSEAVLAAFAGLEGAEQQYGEWAAEVRTERLQLFGRRPLREVAPQFLDRHRIEAERLAAIRRLRSPQ